MRKPKPSRFRNVAFIALFGAMSLNAVNDARDAIRHTVSIGQSSSPVFFLLGSDPVLLLLKHRGYPDALQWNPTWGPALPFQVDRIQQIIDSWEGVGAYPSSFKGVELCDYGDCGVGGDLIENPSSFYLAFVAEDWDDYVSKVDNPHLWYGWANVAIKSNGTLDVLSSGVNLDGGAVVIGGGVPIPEPSTGMLLLVGLAFAGLSRRNDERPLPCPAEPVSAPSVV